MMRVLMSGAELPDEQTWLNVAASNGFAAEADHCLVVRYGIMMYVLLGFLVILPKNHPACMAVPPALSAANEYMDYSFMRHFYMFLSMNQMSGNFNGVMLGEMMGNLGGCAGAIFFGFISAKAGRKPSMILSHLLTIIAYIVICLVTSNFVTQRYTYVDRSYVVGGHLGNRKVRPILDPWLAKTASNELAFNGTFSVSAQQFYLLRIIFSFCLAHYSVCQTAIVESVGVGNTGILLHISAWCLCFWSFNVVGKGMFGTGYFLFDYEGAIIVMAVHKLVQMIVIIVLGQETRNFETSWKADREAERLKNPCWMRGLYYALWLWPQGAWAMMEIQTWMVYYRHHWATTQAGYMITRATHPGIVVTCLIVDTGFRVVHVPVIGRMFWTFVTVTNPLWTSMMMELVNVYRNCEGLVAYTYWMAVYPVFAATYMQADGIPWLLAVCDSMRHLGIFLSDARWPSMLLCGDPMYCWRSQYTYSHGLFYNIGGDGGNISHVTWYLFAKSQRRQCCCPYRKLKADAPEKCCPPCCLGPYVEESGGCTCPCCCASCAGRPEASSSA